MNSIVERFSKSFTPIFDSKSFAFDLECRLEANKIRRCDLVDVFLHDNTLDILYKGDWVTDMDMSKYLTVL